MLASFLVLAVAAWYTWVAGGVTLATVTMLIVLYVRRTRRPPPPPAPPVPPAAHGPAKGHAAKEKSPWKWLYHLIALAGFAVAVWGGLDLPLNANAYRGKDGYTALAIVLGGLLLAGWALQYRKPKKEKKVKHPRHWIFKVLLGIVWTLRLTAVIWTLYVAMLLGSEKHWWEMSKYILLTFPIYWAGTLVYVLVQYWRDHHAHDHHTTHRQVAGWVLNLSRYWLWLGYIISFIAFIVCLGAIGTHAYFQDWYWLAVSTTLACIVGWLISDKMIRQAENRVLTRQDAFAPDSHH